MMLLSSPEDRIFDDLNELLRFLNEHVVREEYAVVLLRTKKSKLNIKCKAWIICDRDRKSHECTDNYISKSHESVLCFINLRQNRRHDDNRHIACFFFIIVKLNDQNNDSWIFEMKNEEHNHASSISDAHSVLRRMTMTREIKSEIRRQLIVQTMSEKIIFFIRLFENFNFADVTFTNVEFTNVEFTNVAFANVAFANVAFANVAFANVAFANVALDSFFVNPMIKARDVYNIQTQMRRDQLGFMTSMQALMHQFDDDDWTYAFQKSSRNQITHLFFSKKSSQSILKTNYEVLIMNCIYKTNKYKMLLMIISD